MKLTLSKMLTQHREPIVYELGSDDSKIDFNSLINKNVKISWNGVIICRKCKKKDEKKFWRRLLLPLLHECARG